MPPRSLDTRKQPLHWVRAGSAKLVELEGSSNPSSPGGDPFRSGMRCQTQGHLVAAGTGPKHHVLVVTLSVQKFAVAFADFWTMCREMQEQLADSVPALKPSGAFIHCDQTEPTRNCRSVL